MDRVKITAVSDLLLLIALIIVGLSGVIKFWIFPWSSKLLTFWGMTKVQWAFMHDWSGVALILLTVLHIILYFDVMVESIEYLFRKKKNVKKKK